MSEFNETAVLSEGPAGRNPAILALAVVGAVLAGALVWFFVAAPLLQGEDVQDAPTAASAAPETAAPAPADAEPVETEPVDAEPAALPVVTYEVFLDRDPFEPVVPEPTAAAADAAADPVDGVNGAVTDGTSGGTTDGTTGGTTDGTTTEGTTGGTTAGCTSSGEDELTCDGRVVSLVDLRTGDDGELVAVIQVDTTLYEVRAGETFAGSFRVQSISAEGVYLLYGDDAFGLDEGERVLK